MSKYRIVERYSADKKDYYYDIEVKRNFLDGWVYIAGNFSKPEFALSYIETNLKEYKKEITHKKIIKEFNI